jgi:hypothetical protein
MPYNIRLESDAVRTLGFAAVGVGYTNIGTSFAHPTRILIVQNLTNATLMFSMDGGTTDHFPLASNGFLVLDCTANKVVDVGGFFIGIGTQMAVKQVGAPTSGSVYVTAMHARGE